MEVARKLPFFFDKSNNLKLEYRTKSEKGAQECKLHYSPRSQKKKKGKKGQEAQGIAKCASPHMGKSVTQKGISPYWYTDKKVEKHT